MAGWFDLQMPTLASTGNTSGQWGYGSMPTMPAAPLPGYMTTKGPGSMTGANGQPLGPGPMLGKPDPSLPSGGPQRQTRDPNAPGYDPGTGGPHGRLPPILGPGPLWPGQGTTPDTGPGGMTGRPSSPIRYGSPAPPMQYPRNPPLGGPPGVDWNRPSNNPYMVGPGAQFGTPVNWPTLDQAGTGGDTVMLRAPDGTVQAVPRMHLQHYLSLGAQQV